MTTIPESVFAEAWQAFFTQDQNQSAVQAAVKAAIAEYRRTHSEVGWFAKFNDEVEKRTKIEAKFAASTKAYLDIADALARESDGPEHLCRIARQLRADLASEQKERDRVTADLTAAKAATDEAIKLSNVSHEMARKAKGELETERVLRQHAWGVIKRIGKRFGWVNREDDAAWQERIVGLVEAAQKRIADLEALIAAPRTTLRQQIATTDEHSALAAVAFNHLGQMFPGNQAGAIADAIATAIQHSHGRTS